MARGNGRRISAPFATVAGMVTRVVPEHSKSAVGRASKLVGNGKGTPEQLTEARAVLSNFRSAHAFPLNAVTVTVRQKALAVNPNAVVAQRLKRLPTILDKLVRIPTMSVTTMQDLGGCRVVFESVQEVERLVEVCVTCRDRATASSAKAEYQCLGLVLRQRAEVQQGGGGSHPLLRLGQLPHGL
jgi:hypothetical protein